jgi:hypothetical protein
MQSSFNLEMRNFFEEQGRIRRRPSPSSGLWRDKQGIFAEAYMKYVAPVKYHQTSFKVFNRVHFDHFA